MKQEIGTGNARLALDFPTLVPEDIGGFWYLASPYSNYPGGPDVAFAEVAVAAACLMTRGYPVFSPIAHSHPIAIYGGLDPFDHSIWLPADRPMMDAAAGLIVLTMDGWADSVGVGGEIDVFRAAGKPVRAMAWPA